MMVIKERTLKQGVKWYVTCLYLCVSD